MSKSKLKTLMSRIDGGMFPFQRRWVYEQSKWTCALKPRQVGFTTYSLLRVLLHCLQHPGHQFYIVARTQKNATKLLRLLRMRWIRAFEATGYGQCQVVSEAATEIKLGNGSVITAMANDPDSMRGLEGSYLFDEMAFWPKRLLENVQGAVWPTIENPFNPDCIIMCISTPWFAEGLYWEFFHKVDLHPQWSRHQFTIYDAVREGFTFDIEGVKARTPGVLWDREYCNAFWLLGSGYFARDLLLHCVPHNIFEPRRILGVDLAKISDLTAVVGAESDGVHLDAVTTWLMRSVDYAKQQDILLDLALTFGADAIAIDITKHASFADTCNQKLLDRHRKTGQPIIPIVGKDFTSQWKTEQTQGLLDDMEAGLVGLDFDDCYIYNDTHDLFEPWPAKQLLDDLGLVKQGTTSNNNLRFYVDKKDAKQVGAMGHGDTYSGLLLARWMAKMFDSYSQPIGQQVIVQDEPDYWTPGEY